MTPREIVLEQIHFRETRPVPYTLPFEQDVGARLDAHYGSPTWRKRLVRYLVQSGGVAKPPREQLDATHYRDAFGTVCGFRGHHTHLSPP